ncbi:helix-turn-helix domain-containing protein [Lunatimonas salinarum]|uniref:helix-turn-helix domain-containing protein n=1 Tax=Lunatimonas salinarum TaxID=1774590 RepID=UPI001ADFDC1D|nr:helix-turn-helix transcriptional regulator [Lunatimonas salinarum]
MPKNSQVKFYQVIEMSTFGEFLRKQRELKGLTQDRLAKDLDLPYTDISKIERGKKKFPFSKLGGLVDYFSLDYQTTKERYVADILIEQAHKYQCSENVFAVAEEQARYIRNKGAKQSLLNF